MRGKMALMLLLAACSSDEPAANANANTNTNAAADAGDGESTSVQDGSPPHDAGIDAPPLPGCAGFPGVLLCDDFDIGSPQPGWSTGGNRGMITTSPNRSPPSAWRVTLDAVPVYGRFAGLSRDLGDEKTTSWRFEASVYLVRKETTATRAAYDPTVLKLASSGGELRLELDQVAEKAVCSGYPSPSSKPFRHEFPFPAQQWHRIAFRATASSASASVAECEIDGVGKTGELEADFHWAKAHLEVQGYMNQGAIEAVYDDVVLDAK